MLRLKESTNLGGRTIMLSELTDLLNAVPKQGATMVEYASAIMEENCLGKPTMAARTEARKRLVNVYSLDFSDPVFRMFHKLWSRNTACRQLLGFQYAWVNDAMLRDSCRYFLPMPPGTSITPQGTSAWVHETYPEKYSEKSVRSVGRSLNSSWYQGGYIEGIHGRTRKAVVPQSENIVFALYLGMELGLSGHGLFTSPMMGLLDSSESALIALAEQAARQGLLRFKHIGDVMEVSFDGEMT